MYGMMVEFEPTSLEVVTRGNNKRPNFGNVATKSEARVAEDVGRGGADSGRKI